MRYTIRERAQADIIEIWRYTARRWSLDQADAYYRNIVLGMESIAEQPALGRSCDEIRAGYFRHNAGSHVIFYRKVDDVVDIVRILHGRRDFRRHLPKA